MRDPHVVRLLYGVTSGPNISYKNPPQLSFDSVLGLFDLADSVLTIEPAEHFASESAARDAVSPFLRAWEVETDLVRNFGTIRFEFLRSEVVDRDPPKPGEAVLVAIAGSIVLVGSGTATLTLGMSQYPEPPRAFSVTVDVERAHRRWQLFREGKEPLPSMAYFVLTLFESAAGSRRDAASTFAVDYDVLDMLGRLSSTRGDPETARKAPKGAPFTELSGAESHWVEQAVRRLIVRLGEHASGASLSQIAMRDLPAI